MTTAIRKRNPAIRTDTDHCPQRLSVKDVTPGCDVTRCNDLARVLATLLDTGQLGRAIRVKDALRLPLLNNWLLG